MLWDAEHAPENVGFSHNVEARTVRRGERVVVEAITRVQSVDLVADPATTRGLFESHRGWQSPPAADVRQPPASLEALRRDYPELVEALSAGQEAELRRLEAEVQRLAALEAAHQKRQLVRTPAARVHLPDPDAADPQASPSPAGGSSNRCWRPPTSRPCGP